MSRLTTITLTKELMEFIRTWRNDILETLRTPYRLTSEMQEEYYNNIICNRDSRTRYHGFLEENKDMLIDGKIAKVNLFVGMGGIENIEWENRRGEISMIINPDYRRQGYGEKVFIEIMDLAFNFLNLDIIWGECYKSGNYKFWEKMIEKYKGEFALLPCRKFYNGQYWDSVYFTFYNEQYKENFNN